MNHYAVLDALLQQLPPTPLETHPQLVRTGFGSYMLRAVLADALSTEDGARLLKAFHSDNLMWPSQK